MKTGDLMLQLFKTAIRLCWLIFALLLSGSCAYHSSEISTTLEAEPTKQLVLCGNGAVFPDPSTLAPPQLQNGIGNSHLPITTTNPQAQIWFDQGINYLHGFYHLEAYRSFQEVTRLDPNCAMGYWGMAMCQPGFGGDNEQWESAIERAVQLQSSSTPLEVDLIRASYQTIFNGIPASMTSWQSIIQKHFDQPDAIAFAAIMLRQLVSSKTNSDALKSMLETAMQAYPNHMALGHYYTHVLEVREDFIEAKPIAEKMALIAPNAAHLVHMPGHIYFLEGEYEKTVTVFEAANTLEEAYHAREQIPYSANQNYLHNLHYLAVAYSELGEKEKALAAAQRYANITLRQDQPQNGNAYMILYEGRILPALVHLRFREYGKAAKQIGFWLSHPALPIENEIVQTYLEMMQTYCNGMQAIEQSNQQAAQSYLGQLKVQLKAFESLGLAKQNTAEFAFINQVFDLLSMAQYELKGWLDNMDINQAFVDDAWKAAFELEAILPYDEPPRLMYPIGESLAHLHLKRNDKEAAAEAVALALNKRPKSPLLLGLTR